MQLLHVDGRIAEAKKTVNERFEPRLQRAPVAARHEDAEDSD
jgi:hypothetical protein